jgi:uridine kinase
MLRGLAMTTKTTPLPMSYGKRPEDLDVLARSPLLRSLGVKEIGELFDQLDQVALAPGTCVFREGEEGDMMYFVLEGQARLRRGALELRPVGPGDHFGELALLSGTKRAATVEAHTTMRLARLSRSRLWSLAQKHPRTALHLTQALARSIGELLIAATDSVGLLAHQRSIPRRVEVKVRRGPNDIIVGTGTLTGALLPQEIEGNVVIGATVNKKPVSLETPILADVDLGALTAADPEGRTIFRRSAALVALEAARRVAPNAIVRMGPPLENAQIVLVPTEDREGLAASLQSAIDRLVRDDFPLREEVWQIEEARTHLAERGWNDAAALLPSRRESVVTLLSCGDTFALAGGPVVPRAGWLAGVTVVPHPHGLLMRLGEKVDRVMPAGVDPASRELEHPRYGAEMTVSERHWLERLGVTSVGHFNEHCVAGSVPELIRVAEGFHEKWIGRIADEVSSSRESVRIIAIAGPSSSGKTTFIKRLTVQLRVNGLRPREISLDDYYVDRERTVRDENGDLDFEAFEAIDNTLLQSHVSRLLAGEMVKTAHFDFVTGKSFASGGKELTLEKNDVLLVEGIHGLNPELLGAAVPGSAVFRIFVHPATVLPFDRLGVLAPDDVRLVRRVVRDRHQRNYTAAETIQRWPSVRRGDIRHIYPCQAHADVVFDSALVYEMSVLKTYAERYLLEVPSSHPAFTTAHRLRNLIDQFVAIYPDHVPPTSVLREFIGGSGFEY